MSKTKINSIRNWFCLSASALALTALSGMAHADTYTLSSANAPWNVQSNTVSDTIVVPNGTVAEMSSSWSSITSGALRIYSSTGWTLDTTVAGSGGGNIADKIYVEDGGLLYIASGGYTAWNSLFQVYGDAIIKLNRSCTSTTATCGTALYLTGTNYFEGDLTMADGAAVSIGLSYSKANLYLGDDTNIILNPYSKMTLYLNGSVPVVMGGSLQGSGTLIMNSGSLTINGANTTAAPYTGTLTMAANTTLIVGDASHTSAALGNPSDPTGNTLALTGTTSGYPSLKGYGTIYMNVVNSGAMVTPGGTSGSLGTLTVAGNYTQDSTGTLVVEVSPDAVSGLHVMGDASLAGTLTISIDAGTYGTQVYNIVQVDGTMTGGFTSIKTTSDAAGAIAAVTQTAHGYQVVTEVVQGTGSDAPIVAGHLVSANRLSNYNLIGSLYDRMAANGFDNEVPVGQNKYVWGEVFGGLSSISRNEVGYHTSSEGFRVGADFRPAWHNATLGVAASYAHEDLKAKGLSTAGINTWHIAAYGGADAKHVRIDGVAFYNSYSTKTERDFGDNGLAKTSPGGYSYGGSLQISKPVYHNLVTPFIRGIYSHQHLDAATETGADLLNLRYYAIDGNNFSADIGVRVEPLPMFMSTKTNLHITVALEHDFSPLGETVTGTFPVSDGQDWSVTWRGDSENTALVGLDVSRQITDRLFISGRVNGRMSLYQTSGEVAFNLRYAL